MVPLKRPNACFRKETHFFRPPPKIGHGFLTIAWGGLHGVSTGPCRTSGCADGLLKNIYEYFDYRQVLKDLYEERKKENPRYSYRVLARRAGFKSAGYFANLLSGKCNLSLNVAYKLSEAFNLKKFEAEYFATLVMFNLATVQVEKKKYYDKLMSLKRTELKTIEERQFECYSEWYHMAIREILDYHLFKGDYKELARMLVPAITPAQARKSIELLESLGMIRKNPFGYYEKLDPVLTTPNAWQSQAITFYQYETLNLAKQAFDLWERSKRNISTLTLSISGEEVKKINEKLNQVQEEILLLAQNAKQTDRVYQINFYAFPLTRAGGSPKP